MAAPVKQEPPAYDSGPELRGRPETATAISEVFGGSAGPGTSVFTLEQKPDLVHLRRSYAPSIATSARGGGTIDGTADDDDDDLVLMNVVPHSSPATSKPELRLPVRPELRLPVQPEAFYQGTFKDIALKLRSYHDTLGTLQQLGISHDVHLPELVLVGDQSAGKSSLMSSLADLSLPHSESTCTRCPTHIRLSRSNEFSCRVSLQQDWRLVADNGSTVASRVDERTPFPPWERQDRQVKEFKTVYEKSELEEVLQWAQIAILSHNQPHELFIPGSGDIASTSSTEVALARSHAKFSPNTVALEIKGPEIPDLSFYDLPGLFQSPPHEEDRYLVNVVDNLVRRFLQNKEAIVMWAVPMNADPDTSKTLSIIRELQAQGRTIGVMTKADLLPPGNRGQWLRILNGSSHQVGEGYFITSKSPDGIDRQQQWEHQFFDNNSERWPDEFQGFRHRCGVENLKAFLVQKLGGKFADALPTIKQKVLAKIDVVDSQLATLPDLPTNAELEVFQALRHFTAAVNAALDSTEMSSQLEMLSAGFRDCILNMKPKVDLRTQGGGYGDNIYIDGSEDDTRSVHSAQANGTRKRQVIDMAPPATPAKRARATNGASLPAASNGDSVPRTPTRGLIAQIRLQPPFTSFQGLGRGFRTIGQIRKDIRRKTKVGMPGVVSDEVYNDLCREAVGTWLKPVNVFLDATMGQIFDVFREKLSVAFKTLQNRTIFRKSIAFIDKFLTDHQKETAKLLEKLYRLETRQLFCLNKDAFEGYKKQELRQLTRARHHLRWKDFCGEESPFTQWEDMSESARGAEMRKMDKESVEMGPDGFEMELDVAAYVRAYYLNAAHRFIEHICMAVVSGMIPEIKAQLDGFLEQKLGLLPMKDPQVFDALMSEGDGIALKRADLKADKTRYGKALKSIIDLEAEANSQSVDRIASSRGNDPANGDDFGHGYHGHQGRDHRANSNSTYGSGEFVH